MRVNSQYGTNTITVEFVDLERAVSDFQNLARDRDTAMWSMGEIVDRVFKAVNSSEGVRQQFAKQGLTMNKFARQVGTTPKRLEDMQLTAGLFGPKERQPDLSWEHHFVIATELGHDTPAVRRRWLKDASKNKWSVYQLKQRLNARLPQVVTMTAEERVDRLRRQLAEAEAELDLRRQDRTRPRKSK